MLASSAHGCFSCHHASARTPIACRTLVKRAGVQISQDCPSWARQVCHRSPCHTSQVARQICLSAMNDTSAVTTEDDVVRLATIGDLVAIHFTCKTADGQVLESSREANEPLSFELGAGEIMGNKLFQGFDEAIRGLAVGQMTTIEASGGEWQRELLFVVPKDHPEVARLEGRYKNQGGLQTDMLVELANGSMAVVVEVADDVIKIDANNMMAGKTLTFELEVIAISKPPHPEIQPVQPEEQPQA